MTGIFTVIQSDFWQPSLQHVLALTLSSPVSKDYLSGLGGGGEVVVRGVSPTDLCVWSLLIIMINISTSVYSTICYCSLNNSDCLPSFLPGCTLESNTISKNNNHVSSTRCMDSYTRWTGAKIRDRSIKIETVQKIMAAFHLRGNLYNWCCTRQPYNNKKQTSKPVWTTVIYLIHSLQFGDHFITVTLVHQKPLTFDWESHFICVLGDQRVEICAALLSCWTCQIFKERKLNYCSCFLICKWNLLNTWR